MLRAKTACSIAAAQLRPILRCSFNSGHNSLHFCISPPARWLRSHRFSESICGPSGATQNQNIIVFRDFSFLSHACLFFNFWLLLFSSLLFSSLDLLISAFPFHLSILSEVLLLHLLLEYEYPATIITHRSCWSFSVVYRYISGLVDQVYHFRPTSIPNCSPQCRGAKPRQSLGVKVLGGVGRLRSAVLT